MQTEAVIFDFDGTLADTWNLYIAAYREVFSEHYGRELSSQEIIDLKPKAELRFFDTDELRPYKEKMYESFLKFYGSLHNELSEGFYHGTLELLAELKKLNMKTAVVTGKSRAAYDISIKDVAGLSFQSIICDDLVARPKPDPEGILLACRELNVEPEKSIYVGDTFIDGEAALAAGAKFAAVLWPKSEAERSQIQDSFKGKDRVFFIETPEQLLEYLD